MLEPIFWNWLILAGICLLLELLTGSLFFLFQTAAAVIVAVLAFFTPWAVQIFLFSLLSIAGIGIWWKFYKPRAAKQAEGDIANKLNNRAQTLIGRKIKLTSPLQDGYGREQIDDSFWVLREANAQDVPIGTLVKIVGAESMELQVEICK